MSSSPIESTLVDVTMPQMGVSVAEGTIADWKKKPGDWIERDETICEISTDKIETEIPSPVAGRVTEILVEIGVTVPVGEVLARIDTERGQLAAAARELARTRTLRPRASVFALAPYFSLAP